MYIVYYKFRCLKKHVMSKYKYIYFSPLNIWLNTNQTKAIQKDKSTIFLCDSTTSSAGPF